MCGQWDVQRDQRLSMAGRDKNIVGYCYEDRSHNIYNIYNIYTIYNIYNIYNIYTGVTTGAGTAARRGTSWWMSPSSTTPRCPTSSRASGEL